MVRSKGMTTNHFRRAVLLTLGAGLMTLGCATPSQGPVPAPGSRSDGQAETPGDRAVRVLLDEQLEADSRANPLSASMRGDHRFDALLPDVRPSAIAKRLDADRARLTRIQLIDRSALSPGSLLNAELLEWELSDRIRAAAFHPEQMPLTQQDGVHISAPQWADSLTFPTEQSLKDYITRLRAVPMLIDQTIANMRDGLAAARTPPRVTMRAVADQAFSQATPAQEADPTKHVMYKPFRERPSGDAIALDAQSAIREAVIPALRNLGEFLRDEYVPKCRESLGASVLPDGEAYYADQLHHHTTTVLTAREIHDIGLSEVARLRRAMMETIARSDFTKHDDRTGEALFRAFIADLRTNPRFYVTSPEELLILYRNIAKRIDVAMPTLFGMLPRLPYGVDSMPDFIAESAPTAYYFPGSPKLGVAGRFIANTAKLDQRPTYEMISLTMHEAVPGHHHQIALAQELEAAGLHEWRTTLGYTAFVEGWALYAERLGYEIERDRGPRGVYEDPYDEFGRLSYEMWRAMRLVVDTGIHAFGWSRRRAIDFMLENSALTRTNVESEVDRYIAWPGQATGYKIGELKIRELRSRAELSLRDRFNLRAFHDAILAAGAVPLTVLERRIDEWIASQLAN